MTYYISLLNNTNMVALFRYKLYNLCSERTYETHHFHDRVERVMIDDHNVPSLKQMLEFADSVREWLAQHPDNVIVVHCKGGN